MPSAATKKKQYWLGFDLGGTKMLAVVFDDAFKPIARSRKKTKANEGAKQGVQRIIAVIDEAITSAGITPKDLAGIGIGCPGPLDLESGVILEMPNLGWRNVKLKAEIEKRFDCGVEILNDVDAGVYGEYRFGAARDARCVIGVFPGTGIGGGGVYEGKILRGKTASCMEIGHMPVVLNGPLCGCGRRGCLETVAGRLAVASAAAAAAYRGDAPNLLRTAGTDLSEIRSRALAESIAAGDVVVEEIMREAARTVGRTLAGVINLLAPDVVVLGGGMVEDLPDLWRSEVKKSAKAQVMPSFEQSFEVVVAQLAGDAAITGAAAWARETLSSK
ncbi:MAG: ROK family protein [Rhodospirillales bacterium]|nr:ROK family protein [Rhodospirillales bacterium]